MKSKIIGLMMALAIWQVASVRADWRDAYDRGGVALWDGTTTIAPSAGSVSATVRTSQTIYQSLQYKFTAAPSNAQFQVFCSNDGTNFWLPDTSGTSQTFTTTSGFFTLGLPPCRQIKVRCLNNSSTTQITPTVTLFAQ